MADWVRLPPSLCVLEIMLSAPLAIVEKRRLGNQDRTEVMNIIGEVYGKTAVIIDDEIDTAGSLIEAVGALEQAGAGRRG